MRIREGQIYFGPRANQVVLVTRVTPLKKLNTKDTFYILEILTDHGKYIFFDAEKAIMKSLEGLVLVGWL